MGLTVTYRGREPHGTELSPALKFPLNLDRKTLFSRKNILFLRVHKVAFSA